MEYRLINGTYQIQDFDKVKEECATFIEREGNLALVISSDDDKKVCKKSRTAIRKKKDEIATLRKQLNLALMGTFNDEAKELEKMLDSADAELKAKIEAFEAIGKPEEPKTFSVVVTSFSEDVINQIKELALKLGCGVK